MFWPLWPLSARIGTHYAPVIGVTTRLAIPTWKEQVSTTADFAQQFLLVDVGRGREVAREEEAFEQSMPEARARQLKDKGVQVLLCGAISQPFAWSVTRKGIQIVPLVAGQVDNVVAAYLCGRLTDPGYLLPGSPPGARRRWRRGRGFCGGRR